MIGTARAMLRCRWSARRLQRYLDNDPSAPLSPGEVTLLEQHLATCERCVAAASRQRSLHAALAGWGRRHPVEPAAVERARALLDDLTAGER